MTWARWEKQGALPPVIFLAVNNRSSICFEDFCFVMKITGFKSICSTRGHRPLQFKLNILLHMHFPLLIFFAKNVLSRENCQRRSGLIFEIGAIDGY